MFNNFQGYLDGSLPQTPQDQSGPLDIEIESYINSLVPESQDLEEAMPTTVNASIEASECQKSYSPHVVYLFEDESSEQEQPVIENVVKVSKSQSRKQTSKEFLDYQNEWLSLRNSKLESKKQLQHLKLLKPTNSSQQIP